MLPVPHNCGGKHCRIQMITSKPCKGNNTPVRGKTPVCTRTTHVTRSPRRTICFPIYLFLPHPRTRRTERLRSVPKRQGQAVGPAGPFSTWQDANCGTRYVVRTAGQGRPTHSKKQKQEEAATPDSDQRDGRRLRDPPPPQRNNTPAPKRRPCPSAGPTQGHTRRGAGW
jgi:hypothetical protein